MPSSIVVISGTGSGLGLSLAKKFLERGDTVYGLTRTRRNWSRARRQASHDSQFHLFQVDVTSEPAVRRFFSTLQRRKIQIEVLINNAGYSNRLRRLEKETLVEFQRNLTNNLVSVFLMCKYATPFFLRQKSGWMINISSMSGKRAVPQLGAYSASKFGVVALSQSLAKENLDSGFKCITVCPGGMNTLMRAKLFGREEASRQQSADFVAEKILEIVEGRLPVETGGDIVIRHGKVTAVNPAPPA